MPFNREKFTELVVYLTDRELDARHLFAQMWFCEFAAKETTGDFITGSTYVVEDYGPRPYRSLELSRMYAAYDIRSDGDFVKAFRKPLLNVFSDKELEVIYAMKAIHSPIPPQYDCEIARNYEGFITAAALGIGTVIPYLEPIDPIEQP